MLASDGYPGSYEKGKVILGIEEAEDQNKTIVFHAGTTLNADGELVTNGGRVLNVVALGSTFEKARDRAYRGVECINFEGKQFRTDIGKRALEGRSAGVTISTSAQNSGGAICTPASDPPICSAIQNVM